MIRYGMILGLLLSFQFAKAQQWQRVDSTNRRLWFAQDTTNNLLYLTGHSKYINQLQINGTANYNGNTYKKLGKGNKSCDAQIFCDFTDRSIFYKGELYINIRGFQTMDDTIHPKGIARWDGKKWKSVGTGIKLQNGDPGRIYDFTIYKDELYVVGSFDSAGSVAAKHVAKWDGNQWYAVVFPTLNDLDIQDIIFYKDELYIGGAFSTLDRTIRAIAKWDGSNWQAVATSGMFRGSLDAINTMAAYRGELYVGGYFLKPNSPGNFIARWNGKEWREVGDGVYPFIGGGGSVYKMKVIKDKLFVAGQFDKASDIAVNAFAVWNGEQWCTFDTTGALGAHPIHPRIYDFTLYNDTLYTSPSDYGPGNEGQYFIKWVGDLEPTRCGKKWHVGQSELAQNKSDQFVVYPNPGSKIITIEIRKNAKAFQDIKLFDLRGSELQSTTVQANMKVILDIEWLAPGSYVIAAGTQRKLFIKQ